MSENDALHLHCVHTVCVRLCCWNPYCRPVYTESMFAQSHFVNMRACLGSSLFWCIYLVYTALNQILKLW